MAADPVTGALSVADDLLKVALQKDAQRNTQAMVQALVAKRMQKVKDEVNDLVARAAAGDKEALDELQKLSAA